MTGLDPSLGGKVRLSADSCVFPHLRLPRPLLLLLIIRSFGFKFSNDLSLHFTDRASATSSIYLNFCPRFKKTVVI